MRTCVNHLLILPKKYGMISLDKRIQAFALLGKWLVEVGENKGAYINSALEKLENAVANAVNYNGWFVEPNVRFMIASLGKSLAIENINRWILPYADGLQKKKTMSTVGVVMAGNIPLVGFHDFLSVLLSGNKIIAKLSSDDNKLLPIVADLLISIEPDFKNYIEFTDGRLTNFDAIIATGSNNTSRYFEYYFGKYPNIIRKNRNSIALITGDETTNELKGIAKDIFMYYGLGCRNVTHIMVPQGYDFKNLLDVVSENEEVVKNHKYFNNYEYNKAIYLVNGNQHFDTGNLLVTEDDRYTSPVSVLHYSYYDDIETAVRVCGINRSKIQCVVSVCNALENAVAPGESQSPNLWDYADGIDTMQFLLEL